MLYASVILGLILAVNGQYEPHEVHRGTPWVDLPDCDHDSWYFANTNQAVHSRHRDGFEDMTGGTCYYGEWSDSGNGRNNLWGEAQWVAFDEFNNPLNNFELRVSGRVFGFCDYEPADSVGLNLRTNWIDNGPSAVTGRDDTWGSMTNIFEKQKNRGNCNDWTGELTNANTNWLGEVECTNGNNGASCYHEFEYDMVITGGNRFALQFYAVLNNGWGNEAWAYGHIRVEIVTGGEGDCCTGTRLDHPDTKSCSAFGERRNCENKGCHWSDAPHCSIPCCRKDDSTDKFKCKALTNDLSRCQSRGNCEIRECSCNGFWDGLNKPEGDPCPPN